MRHSRLTPAAALALLLAAAAAPLARAGARQPPPSALALTGRDWVRLSPDAREAYLSGFLAGAAAQQASAGAKTRPAGPAVAARAVALQRADALAFPYRANVYRSHLDDYFFYENRRREPLIAVIVDLHAGQGRTGRE
jgi:hypothetical protein